MGRDAILLNVVLQMKGAVHWQVLANGGAGFKFFEVVVALFLTEARTTHKIRVKVIPEETLAVPCPTTFAR